MSELTIGSQIQEYTLYIRNKSVQGFIIEWMEDVEMTIPMSSMDGETIQVIVGHRDAPIKIYTAICSGNTATFPLTVNDTDFQYNLYDGVVLQILPEEDAVLIALRVEVGPS